MSEVAKFTPEKNKFNIENAAQKINVPEINKYQDSIAKKEVEDFFNKQTEYYKEFQKDDAERAEDKFYEYSKQLKDFFVSKERQDEYKKNPEKISEALAYVADIMKTNDPLVRSKDESWKEVDDDIKQESQQLYNQTKDIFMKACTIIYPGLKDFNAELINMDIDSMNDNLKDKDFISTQLPFKNSKMEMKENPKFFLDKLNGYNEFVASGMANFIRDKTIENNSKINDSQKSELRTGVATLFRMEIIKDSIQEKVYGQAKNTKEISEIDKMREKLTGKKSEKILPTENEKKETNTEDIKITSFLENLKKDEQSETKRAWIDTSLIEGIKDIPDVKDGKIELNDYIRRIIKQIDTVKEKIMTDNPKILEFDAGEDAAKEVYDKYPGSLKKILDAQFKRDADRMRNIPGTIIVTSNPRYALMNFYSRIKRNKIL